jgi:hypothetical protein
MGLTCSLLGHVRDESETESEREQRGADVVVSTREVRECVRCGDRTVVSENKEVRPADPGGTADDAEERQPGGHADEHVEEKRPDEDAEVGQAADDADGGIILEGDADVDADRTPGEWPSAPDTSDTEADPDTGVEADGDVGAVTDREWPDEGPTGGGSSPPTGPGTGIAAAEPDPPDTGEAVFVCPACEYSELSSGSSHREGDICPECSKGYLAERTRN